jgi:uncharacterized protein (TIGR02265 family)
MAEVNLTQMQIKSVAFEAAFKGMGISENSLLREKIKAYYDPNVLQASYTAEAYLKCVEIIRHYLFGHLPDEKALFEMGRLSFNGFYKKTVVGGIILTAIRVMSPQRLAALAERVWKDSGFGQLTVASSSKRGSSGLYRNFLIPPHLAAGVAIEGFTTAGYKNPRYTLEELPSPDAPFLNYNITYEWD